MRGGVVYGGEGVVGWVEGEGLGNDRGDRVNCSFVHMSSGSGAFQYPLSNSHGTSGGV